MLHVAITRGRHRVGAARPTPAGRRRSSPSSTARHPTTASSWPAAREATAVARRRAGAAPAGAGPRRGRGARGRAAGLALERSRRDKVPAYVVLSDRHLQGIAVARPASLQELRALPGIGPTSSRPTATRSSPSSNRSSAPADSSSPSSAPVRLAPTRCARHSRASVRRPSRTQRGVELGHELGRRDHAVGLLADLADLVPVVAPVQPQRDPSPATDVGGPEEALGLGLDQLGLHAGRRGADEVREVVLVVAVLPQRGEGRLAADEPRRRAVARALGHLGERQADLPQVSEEVLAIGGHDGQHRAGLADVRPRWEHARRPRPPRRDGVVTRRPPHRPHRPPPARGGRPPGRGGRCAAAGLQLRPGLVQPAHPGARDAAPTPA